MREAGVFCTNERLCSPYATKSFLCITESRKGGHLGKKRCQKMGWGRGCQKRKDPQSESLGLKTESHLAKNHIRNKYIVRAKKEKKASRESRKKKKCHQGGVGTGGGGKMLTLRSR